MSFIDPIQADNYRKTLLLSVKLQPLKFSGILRSYSRPFDEIYLADLNSYRMGQALSGAPSYLSDTFSMKEELAVIILAAGLGKRMRSELPKVAISTRQMPLIHHVLEAVSGLRPKKVVVVTGYKREHVEKIVREHEMASAAAIEFAYQEKQIGTGNAVKCALSNLQDFTGSVLILYGDIPLISTDTLKQFYSLHKEKSATLSLISFKVSGENAYGRVVRSGESGYVERIVEARDCTPQQLRIEEVNSGIYLVDSAFLAPAVNDLKNENAQHEYYLTDILERAAKEGQAVNAMLLTDGGEVQGVNTLYDLSLINRALAMEEKRQLIEKGVIFELPDTCLVDKSAEIATGVRIGPNVQILGKTKIGAGTVIEGTAYIRDSIIEEDATIKLGVRMEGAHLGKGASVGPFANLRPNSVLEEKARIGNFVEMKNARLGSGAKANHLTYLGDAEIGRDSNIGAGTITCNYDGYQKFQTKIGSEVFIGSNTALVAPVTIEDGASIGAGSVITKNVEKDSLAFTRPPQVSKSGWARRKRDLKKSAN